MLKSLNKWTGKKSRTSLFIVLSLFIIFLTAFRLAKKGENKVRDLILKLIQQLVADNADLPAEVMPFSESEQEKLAALLLAQSRHETGNFKSQSYKVGHNLFGMKRSTRPYDTGEYLGHASYPNDEESIKDMLAYLVTSKAYTLREIANMDVRQYVLFLKSRGYFEDDTMNYYNGMTRFYSL